MALDGIVLNRINEKLQEYLPARLVKINNISDTEILMQIKGPHSKGNLLISCHSQFNRINMTSKHYHNPDVPSNFVMLLRKHLENGMITKIEQGGLDRYLQFTIKGHDELGEPTVHYFFVELMGKYANAILVDKNMKIMDALKRIPPFENQSRTVQPSAMFTYIAPQDKKNPFNEENCDLDTPLTAQFAGFSPLLAKEVTYRLHNGEIFKEIMKNLKSSENIYVTELNGQVYYHIIPLTHLSDNHRSFPIMDAMDELYFYKEQKDRIRQQIGDLFKVARHELKKNEQKKVKLEESLEEALDCDKWRQYGDLLFAYQYQVKKGLKSITLTDFDGETEVQIPLDEKLDARANAKKCFQKYNKGKSGQIHIQKQIDICNEEIRYFTALNQQLSLMDVTDSIEVREELISYGYLKDHGRRNRKKKEPQLHFLTINYDEDTIIYVGKNNRQNDFVTFKKARKDDLWFHALDYHGSHTILHTTDVTEDKIRLCAMLAAYYSEARNSSSIPVSYTPVRNLKKVPQAKAGFTTMSTYKTIYIDIDNDTLRNYIDLQELL